MTWIWTSTGVPAWMAPPYECGRCKVALDPNEKAAGYMETTTIVTTTSAARAMSVNAWLCQGCATLKVLA